MFPRGKRQGSNAKASVFLPHGQDKKEAQNTETGYPAFFKAGKITQVADDFGAFDFGEHPGSRRPGCQGSSGYTDGGVHE